MAKIEWSMWANEQAIASSLILILGGILGLNFNRQHFAAYSIALGAFILLFEYPRGSRQKGKTQERFLQKLLTPIVGSLGVVSRNYYIRFLFYLMACIPSVFTLSTVLGAACLFVTSLIYLKAALSSEIWKPVKNTKDNQEQKTIPVHQPPSKPPPRGLSLENLTDERQNQV